MGKFFLYLILSLALHITAVACFGAMQFLSVQKEPKKKKILYVKNIKKTEIKKSEIKKNSDTPKNKNTPPKTNNTDKPKINKPKTIIKENVPKANIKKTNPEPPKTPQPKKTPIPPKKKTEEELKIETLKKIPAFKKWPEERLKNIELPPGLKSWGDVEAVEKELNKLNLLPAGSDLGNTAKPEESPSPETSPINTPTPIPTNYMNWKEYKFENNKDEYQIKFYNQDLGYILTVDKIKMKIFVKYFPFDIEKIKKETNSEQIEIILPEDLEKDKIKEFELPFTQEDLELEKNMEENKNNKDKIVKDVIRQKDLIENTSNN